MHHDLEFIVENFKDLVQVMKDPNGRSYLIKLKDQCRYSTVYIGTGGSIFKIQKYRDPGQIWIDLPNHIEPDFHQWLKLISV